MTAITIDLTTEEVSLLNATPESTVLKWAYHSSLDHDGSPMAFKAIKANIHAIVDPIHSCVAFPTDGYTPYDADGRPMTSNEDAIGYAAQFFGRKPHGRDWVTRKNGVHSYNPDGWDEAYTELFDESSWDLWLSIRAKVCEARIRAGLTPLYGTLPSYIEQIKEAMLTPDAVDEVIAISVEEDSLPNDKDQLKAELKTALNRVAELHYEIGKLFDKLGQ